MSTSLRMYSVFDVKAQAFLQPFFFSSDGQAIRVFSDCVRDPSHAMGKHPEDYSLFRVGSFDVINGHVSQVSDAHAVECLLIGKQVEVIK